VLVTGEQFNIMCAPCILLVALAKNSKDFSRWNWPAWDASSVFVDCFEVCCPHTLLSIGYSENDEFTWQMMTGIRKPFVVWWQELSLAYDKMVKKHPALPVRPI